MKRALLLAALLPLACAKHPAVIAAGSEVTMHYTLKVDGKVVDSSKGGKPLTYTQGSGEIVPGLESKMAGHKAGDSFEVVVEPKDGYGEHSDAGVRKVPWKSFGEKKPDLTVGQVIGGQANGRPFQAKVVKVEKDGPTLDLNHPLAGKTLDFAIEVVAVKPGPAAR